MTNLAKIEFAALDISGKNYLSWILDAEIHLDADGLGNTIKEGNAESAQNKAKAMILLRRHLHEGLKVEYLTVKDPLLLWNNLKERYDHQKTVILPKARYDWLHLRLQDFKSPAAPEPDGELNGRMDGPLAAEMGVIRGNNDARCSEGYLGKVVPLVKRRQTKRVVDTSRG
ncbi:hypothetical protein V6N13_060273 [Hibiscus sabdariffa]